MQKILCVFAHPDDEAFGPGGTIALWAKQGAQIHLLCVTKGEAGINDTGTETASLRTKELEASAKILGIEKIEYLDYIDGEIGNIKMIEIEAKIIEKINKFQPDTLLTFNLNGVSGHIDHITVASATTQAFRKTASTKKLYYYSMKRTETDDIKEYFVYSPPGITPEQADEIIDVSSVWDIKVEAMYCHRSQIKDVEWILSIEEAKNRNEYFLVCGGSSVRKT
ncbi:MAG: PIG-L family deacetylase [bacterium]|nr:PIG-L family deacetylase [bacterium]